jgi:hypothetical protein
LCLWISCNQSFYLMLVLACDGILYGQNFFFSLLNIFLIFKFFNQMVEIKCCWINTSIYHLLMIEMGILKCSYHSIYTRPGLRPGFRVLTGSLGLIFFLKKKSKWRRFIKKINKSQRVATEFLTGSHRVFPSLVFSSIRLGSSPESIGFRIRPGFKTMVYIDISRTIFFFYLLKMCPMCPLIEI